MISNSKALRCATHVILALLALAALAPFLLLIISSLTHEKALMDNGYSFLPKRWSLDAYVFIWSSRAKIVRAYGITLLTTCLGTLANLLLTTLLAYPLSIKKLPGRGILSFYIFFTMLFNGGLVPSYMTWTQIFRIKDTLAALLLPNLLVNCFYVILMRTYFSTSIPHEIIEAARIDGSGELSTLMKIVLPLSRPMMATLGLMAGLGYWNDWMNGLYYITKRTELYNIQNVLNRIISNAEFLVTQQNLSQLLAAGQTVPSVGIRMAIAVITILPILVIYPFFQKSFVRGIVVGGVKG